MSPFDQIRMRSGIGVRRVVQLCRRLAVHGTGDQVSGTRVPAIDPGVLQQEREAGLAAALLVEQYRDHRQGWLRFRCPALPVQGRGRLALLPGTQAVTSHCDGNRTARGKVILQSSRPGLTRTQIPVVLEDRQPALAQRLGQRIDQLSIEPVVAQEEVELRIAVAALEKDPQCGFISSDCVKYAQGESGLCYVFEETWDCGTLHGIPVLEGTSSMDCAGPVRCMGEDCLDAAEEQSSDFAEAAAALEAAHMAASDMGCSSGSCVVFSGDAMECKKAVGGIVNCCTTPDGISLADYLSLVLAMGKIDNALMGLDAGNALRGSWETLRNPVVSAWSEVTKSFTSVANNLMGKTAAEASDAAVQLSLDAFKQALMKQTAEWVADVFGEAAANALFTVDGGAAFVGGSLQSGTIQLGA